MRKKLNSVLLRNTNRCAQHNRFNFNEAEKDAVVFTYNASLIRKLKNAMDEYPAIQLIRENEDGSCQFIMPKKWFAPRLPAKLTPEQRAAYVERGKKLAKLLHGT